MEKYARLGQTLLRTAHQTISVARPSSESLQVPAVVDSSAILGQQVPDRQGSKTAPSAMKICREGLASKATTGLAVSLRRHYGRFPSALQKDSLRISRPVHIRKYLYWLTRATPGATKVRDSDGSFSADSPLIAGTGFAGSSGDGLPGPETLLKLPANAIMDPNTRDIYVADYSNYAVKVVHGDTGMRSLAENCQGRQVFQRNMFCHTKTSLHSPLQELWKP